MIAIAAAITADMQIISSIWVDLALLYVILYFIKFQKD